MAPWVASRFTVAGSFSHGGDDLRISSDSLKQFASFAREQNAFWAKVIKDVGVETSDNVARISRHEPTKGMYLSELGSYSWLAIWDTVART